VRVQIHAVSPQSMMAAVDAGVKYLVHTPQLSGWLAFDDAAARGRERVKQLSTIGFGVPSSACSRTTTPALSRGKAVADAILDGEARPGGRLQAVNARTSWDAGVVYGYGTDTNLRAGSRASRHELHSLSLMFSDAGHREAHGAEFASYIEMSDQLGTLEPVSSRRRDPRRQSAPRGTEHAEAKVVLKGGVVVSDQR